MDKYNFLLEGKIIIVKNMKFSNCDIDHAWNTGRPCLVLYTDEEFEYILPITHSIHKRYKEEYFYIDNANFLEFYQKRYKENILNKKNKLSSKNKKTTRGYINLKHVYKLPLAYRDEIGKIKYDCYKNVIKKLNIYHNTDTLEETIKIYLGK